MKFIPTPIEIDPRDDRLLKEIGRLRVKAWATEVSDLPEKTDMWLDEFELKARHWGIFNDGQLIAAARLSIHDRLECVPHAHVYQQAFDEPLPSPIASINRLVTHPEFRGRGCSDALDAVRMVAAEQSHCGCCVAVTPTGETRVRQLRALGFKIKIKIKIKITSQGDFFHTMESDVLLCRFPRQVDKELVG